MAALRSRSIRVRSAVTLLLSLSDQYTVKKYDHPLFPPAIHLIILLLFYKVSFGIKEPSKVDIPLKTSIGLGKKRKRYSPCTQHQ